MIVERGSGRGHYDRLEPLQPSGIPDLTFTPGAPFATDASWWTFAPICIPQMIALVPAQDEAHLPLETQSQPRTACKSLIPRYGSAVVPSAAGSRQEPPLLSPDRSLPKSLASSTSASRPGSEALVFPEEGA